MQKQMAGQTEDVDTRTLGDRGVGPHRPRDMQVPVAGEQDEINTRALSSGGLGPCRPHASQEPVESKPLSIPEP